MQVSNLNLAGAASQRAKAACACNSNIAGLQINDVLTSALLVVYRKTD